MEQETNKSPHTVLQQPGGGSAEIAFTVSTEILWKKRAQMVFSLLLRE